MSMHTYTAINSSFCFEAESHCVSLTGLEPAFGFLFFSFKTFSLVCIFCLHACLVPSEVTRALDSLEGESNGCELQCGC